MNLVTNLRPASLHEEVWRVRYYVIITVPGYFLRDFVERGREILMRCCTQGAGDAFLGALAYFKAYYPHLPMDECIRRACVVATQSVLKHGTHASFPRRDNLPADLFM